MTERKRRPSRSGQATNQRALWIISVLVIISMVCGLIVQLLPPQEAPLPETPFATESAQAPVADATATLAPTAAPDGNAP